jgi:hypothetical protein
LSRPNNKENGVIIIVMQRFHQDDLVGHVLEQDGWEVLSFPAIAEEDETLAFETIFGQQQFQRKLGEALHPERESLQTLKKTRESIGEYNFSSQYQRCPIPVGGAIGTSEWLRYYEPGSEPSEFGHVLQSWDTANEIVGQLLQEMDGIQTHDSLIFLQTATNPGIRSPQVKDYILKYQTHRFRLVCRISRGDSVRDPVREADRCCCLWTCCSTRQIDTSPSASWLILGLNLVAWMLQYTS